LALVSYVLGGVNGSASKTDLEWLNFKTTKGYRKGKQPRGKMGSPSVSLGRESTVGEKVRWWRDPEYDSNKNLLEINI